MELSQSTIRNLQNINDTNTLNNETYEKLLEIAISHICEKVNVKNFTRDDVLNSAITKNLLADVISFLVEAARCNLDGDKLDAFVSTSRINGTRVQKLCDTYVKHSEEIRSNLMRIGDNLPHITDVNWRFDYCIKSSVEDSIGSPLYHIRLNTEKHGKSEFVTFVCTTQQLQDLVYKLKDAVRHVEKLAVTAN